MYLKKKEEKWVEEFSNCKLKMYLKKREKKWVEGFYPSINMMKRSAAMPLLLLCSGHLITEDVTIYRHRALQKQDWEKRLHD